MDCKKLLLVLFVFLSNGFVYSMEQKPSTTLIEVNFSEDALNRLSIANKISADAEGNLVYLQDFSKKYRNRKNEEGNTIYFSHLSVPDSTKLDCSVFINEVAELIAGKFYCWGYNEGRASNNNSTMMLLGAIGSGIGIGAIVGTVGIMTFLKMHR